MERIPQAAKNSANQSWRSASGNFYQRYVQNRINEEASPHGLLALTETELHAALPNLIEFLQAASKTPLHTELNQCLAGQ